MLLVGAEDGPSVVCALSVESSIYHDRQTLDRLSAKKPTMKSQQRGIAEK